MPDPDKAKEKSFTAFRSAAEEVDTKLANDAAKREEQSWDNEGGHMSSTSGRVMRVSRTDLPYVVTLEHHGGEKSEHAFAAMREAEAFIRRNTPVPSAVLATTYDRPPSATSPAEPDSPMSDESILARLKVIDRRLRQISTECSATNWMRVARQSG